MAGSRAAKRAGDASVAKVALPIEGDELRVVIVADTHSSPHPESAARIAAERPHHIVHAGDIGDLDVLSQLAALAPVTAVRGNIDAGARGIPDFVLLDVVDGDRVLVTALVTHIAVYGPKLRAEVARRAARDHASVVLCGHSHVPFAGRDRGLAVFNPGSIGPRRFQLPIVFGVMTVRRDGITLRHVDVETGEAWRPPARPESRLARESKH